MARLSSRLAAAAAGLVTFVSAAAIATSGDFTALTMNVAGLPTILNSNGIPGDMRKNSQLIGELLTRHNYDVINLQEDFNYHRAIYSNNKHRSRTATTGGAIIGSGLNTVSNFDWINFTRLKWKSCSDASAADCWTPKGYTFMRVLVSEGVYIDMYNLHADAGVEKKDLAARAANLKQVSDYINEWSIGNAVIVFGDTNARYTRPGDTSSLNVFNTANNMIDPFIELSLGGVIPTVENNCPNPALDNTCETVDKVFYRGSRQLELKATSFSYESSKFLSESGTILSDHNPVLVNYTWTASSSFRQSNFFGGPHGTWSNDLPALPEKPKTSVITFHGGARVDSVGLILTDGTPLVHGGKGGVPTSLTLTSDEYWVSAMLCQGKKASRTRIFYILATTSTGRTLASGVPTGDCTTFSAPDGWQIVGYNGQFGDEVDQLAFIYAPKL